MRDPKKHRSFFDRFRRKEEKRLEGGREGAEPSPSAPETAPPVSEPKTRPSGPKAAPSSPQAARKAAPYIPRVSRPTRKNPLVQLLIAVIVLAGGSYLALWVFAAVEARETRADGAAGFPRPPKPGELSVVLSRLKTAWQLPGDDSLPAESSEVLEPMPAEDQAKPSLKSAVVKKDPDESKPTVPEHLKGIRGYINPDEEKKEKSYKYDPSLIPPQYDQRGLRIKPTRLRTIQEAGDSGWGYTSPAGFAQDPDDKSLWRGGEAVIRVTSAHAIDECRPVCGGKLLGVGQTKRSTSSGHRTYTFQCNKSVSLGGKEWPLHESTYLHIRSSACVITTLAFQSSAARQKVQDDYFNMRRRLSPLPPQPEKPLLDSKGKSKKVRALR